MEIPIVGREFWFGAKLTPQGLQLKNYIGRTEKALWKNIELRTGQKRDYLEMYHGWMAVKIFVGDKFTEKPNESK